jgi:prepilin-type N-terminal cleavage/methylation domain-containing protein
LLGAKKFLSTRNFSSCIPIIFLRGGNPMDHGFTLIELLVVMAIAGILTAIAVPEYAAFRARGFDTRARFDLYHVAAAEEGYFLDNERYLSCSGMACADLPGIRGLSNGVTLSITATTTGFVGTASHPKGSGKVFRYESDRGGFVD